ncbi:MAG: GTP cyclohydrolase I FolE [Saprospiraceae bacterium]|nr:GTP cyclohydrolase I FolE [Saprospiraceae bacterium]
MKFENSPVVNGHQQSTWDTPTLRHDLEMGDQHTASSLETPLRDDAFALSNDQKMVRIAKHFREIMHTLGLDLSDDSLSGTPNRVAKMYVEEFFSGLDPDNKPSISLFENKFGYQQMLVEKNISLHSHCEHHFVPITGKVHIAYFPNGKVIGLSKLHRIAKYYAKRPQVQERLTMQIAHDLQEILGTKDVAVMIDAVHHCVCSRGIEDQTSSTITVEYGGKFLEAKTRNEFLSHIR